MVNDHHQGICLNDFPELDNGIGFACVGEFEALETLGNVKSKSVDIDDLPIHFIKLIFPYISHLIVDLVNCMLSTSVFPVCWKIVRVVPIPTLSEICY